MHLRIIKGASVLLRITNKTSSYHDRYPRLYAALKCYGFSPAMAIRIMIDASRKDAYAWDVVRIARHHRTA
jgi:hypothetical protein